MKKLDILISYAYWNEKYGDFFREHKNELNILLDSGAFTAHSSGKEIHLKDYHNFLKKNKDIFDEYIQLDVLGNFEKTKINYRKSLDAGFSPLPVFSLGSPIDYLYEISDRRFCLGNLINQDKDDVVNFFLNNIQNPNKIHLLGIDRLYYFKHKNPPQSMDASNWLSGLRFGNVPITSSMGRSYSLNKEVFMNNDHPDFFAIDSILKKYDFDIRSCREQKEWRNTTGGPLTQLQKVTAISGYLRQKFVQDKIGKQLYLVVSTAPSQLVLLEMILKLKRNEGS
jgi:hypothetical protein